MENNGKGNYAPESDNPQNEKEKQLDTARLNVDSERRLENLKDDNDQDRYYENKNGDDSAKKAGKEGSYRSPEDERAFATKNTENYIKEDNPDSEEASPSDFKTD